MSDRKPRSGPERAIASLATLAILVMTPLTSASVSNASSGGTSPGVGRHIAHQPVKRAAKRRTKPPLKGNPARAIVTYQAMQKYFYIPGSGLYRGEPYSYLWPFSQALAATASVGWIPGQKAKFKNEAHVRLYGLQRYWGMSQAGTYTPPVEAQAPPAEQVPGSGSGSASGESASAPSEEAPPAAPAPQAPPSAPAPTLLPSFNGSVILADGTGNTSYYDDNEWVGIELARLYRLYREPSALSSAEQIMSFVISGWQSSPSLACPGGMPFSTANNLERNTVTTAPAVELGVQLYRLTRNTEYLQFAEKAYEWVRTCLLGSDGLYADHVGVHGKVTPTEWSYNQGTMIGAGTLLYQATGDSGFLYQARQSAAAALAHFTAQALGSENPFFVAVYFRNLLYLDSVTHDPPGPKIAQAFVDSAWQHQRQPGNVFEFGSPASSQLLYQASFVEIYAMLSEPASTYF